MTWDYNETETRTNLITPALQSAGWGKVEQSRMREEVIAPGRILGGGRRADQEKADYVLVYKNQKLAVIEAKRVSEHPTKGLAQAKKYAEKLNIRFAYSTNGKKIYRVDMDTGDEGYIDAYPSPAELWHDTYPQQKDWRDRFAEVPFEDQGGHWEARYYQHNAISKTLEAIADGKDRILLTLATGTGKTAIAFQLAWKLFHSRWNLKDWRNDTEPSRRPRILFLADRNILADQAFNAFNAFSDDALARVSPKEIKKKGAVPKNASIFFTIFQTFMSGTNYDGEPEPYFGEYPPDFFDFIIIDECHRGGANDESTWRGILEYFSPAVQLGLTATPKRDANVDTYRYFGEPVYVYSLKEGINDGFLTPFKVKEYESNIDTYTYDPDDEVVEGVVEEGREYGEDEMNRVIEIQQREEHRVQNFMEAINQNEKTLVFCANQKHALAVRDLINQIKISDDPNYCVRVTADEGADGERWLRTFQDNEKTIPTVLTTSQKLSTGVDARNVRNIVLLRPIKSMIEFKQIIGRGTRLFDNKDYFTIYDFVKAHEHFQDEEWDGEPIEPEPCGKCGQRPCVCEKTPCKDCGQRPCVCEKEPEPCPECGEDPCICEKPRKVVIKLSDGRAREIESKPSTSYWGPDGKPLSAQEFIEYLFGVVPDLFKNENELRDLWSRPDTRKKLLQGLEEKGFGPDQLTEAARIIDATDSDLYDVLAYIAYAQETMSRAERVETHKNIIYSHYSDKQQEFLAFVLDHYVSEGVMELDRDRLPALLKLKYGELQDAVAELGDVEDIGQMFVDFQGGLYREATS